MSDVGELLVEIGAEEIPARMTRLGAEALRDRVCADLEALRLSFGATHVAYTPRRLVLVVEALQARQADLTEVVTGPPAAAAFRDGAPTPAAVGFARSKGVDVSALTTVDTAKGPYVAAEVRTEGRASAELLAEVLPRAIAGIPWPKSMRWGTSGAHAFVRPLHWIVALYGGRVVPFEWASVKSGDRTEGHRFHARGPFEVKDAASHRAALAAARVVLDAAERAARVEHDISRLAAEAGGVAIEDDGLRDEIANLVEWPTAALGSFSPDYLELPEEVLVAAMRSHQRYVALRGPDGALLPRFVVVANTQARDPAVVARGNERVLAARLSDARFFWRQDRARSLREHGQTLSDRIFLRGLGSVADKATRVERLAGWLADREEPAARTASERAAALCKADLGSLMVGEFPELQGVMGSYYAAADGEPAEVARAVREHYQPRFAGDALPPSPAGAVVSVADKLDSLVGCFGIGLKPTGNQDPYALRRGVLGVLHVVEARGWRTPLRALLAAATQGYGDRIRRPADEVVEDALEFALGRLRHFAAQQMPADAVEAVLSTGDDVVPDLVAKMQALSAIRGRPSFEPLAVAFKRVSNITKDLAQAPYPLAEASPAERPAPAAAEPSPAPCLDEAALTTAEERGLLAAVRSLGEQSRAASAARDFDGALRALVELEPPVAAFFDAVLVMDPDERVRDLRLSLLVAVRELFAPFADFARIRT